MITVSQLIEKLQKFPAEMPVVVAGFDEAGFDDLGTVEAVKIYDSGNRSMIGWYLDAGYRQDVDLPAFDALLLNF